MTQQTLLAPEPTETAGENRQISRMLHEAADLLERQSANPYRVAAYRKAADTIARLDRPLRAIFEDEGGEGLQALPGIGSGIANAIAEILITGQWNQLARLRGDVEAEKLPRSAPGSSLKAAPDVSTLLEVDREYRDKAAAGGLPTIAPKRFNPDGEAWLPVLHANRGGWHFTLLYSNTERAHQLGRTHDWVVAYFYDDDHLEGQHTVVTEIRGPLAGRRVVRGREAECGAYYRMRGAIGPAVHTTHAH